MADIHKAAGIIIRDKKLLVERSEGKELGTFFAHEVMPRLAAAGLID
jgi:hypothetical protein